MSWRDFAPFSSNSTLSDGPYRPCILLLGKRGSISENTTALTSYDKLLSAVYFLVPQNLSDLMCYTK